MFRIFSVGISVSPHACFILELILISMFLGWCTCELEVFHAGRAAGCLRDRGGAGGGGWSTDRRLVGAPSNFIAGRPKAALLFWLFGDFRCGALLFMVILVKYKNR